MPTTTTAQEIAALTKRLEHFQDQAEDVIMQRLKEMWFILSDRCL